MTIILGCGVATIRGWLLYEPGVVVIRAAAINRSNTVVNEP